MSKNIIAGSSMMAFNALAAGSLGPLDSLLSSALQLQMLDVYLERLNDVMDTPREPDNSAVIPSGPLTGAISLEDVAFRYGGNGPYLLGNVCLDVRAGSRVAP
jgi:ATP-binding cassette subfamily B protein